MRIFGPAALMPAGIIFIIGSLIFIFNGLAYKFYWLVYLGGLVLFLAVLFIVAAKKFSDTTKRELISVWMPGILFFSLGTTFLWAGIENLEDVPEMGRVVVLGAISAVLGFLILVISVYVKIRYRNDPEGADLTLGRLLGGLGALVAAGVLMFFYLIGFFLLYKGEIAGAAFFMGIPSIFVVVFGTIWYFKKKKAG